MKIKGIIASIEGDFDYTNKMKLRNDAKPSKKNSNKNKYVDTLKTDRNNGI